MQLSFWFSNHVFIGITRSQGKKALPVETNVDSFCLPEVPTQGGQAGLVKWINGRLPFCVEEKTTVNTETALSN